MTSASNDFFLTLSLFAATSVTSLFSQIKLLLLPNFYVAGVPATQPFRRLQHPLHILQ